MNFLMNCPNLLQLHLSKKLKNKASFWALVFIFTRSRWKKWFMKIWNLWEADGEKQFLSKSGDCRRDYPIAPLKRANRSLICAKYYGVWPGIVLEYYQLRLKPNDCLFKKPRSWTRITLGQAYPHISARSIRYESYRMMHT